MSRGEQFCRRAFPVALAVVLVGSLLDLGATPAVEVDDKTQHVLAFLALAVLAVLGNPRWPLAARVIPGLLAYGLLIEAIQWWLPWREFSWLDWAADAAGVLAGALAARRAQLMVAPEAHP